MNTKRTGKARPRTCAFCGERHYVSIVCDEKRGQLSGEIVPGRDIPAPPQYIKIPDKMTSGVYYTDKAGNLILNRKARFGEGSSVVMNPDWET